MNYIGSKLRLCPHFILETIKKVCGDNLNDKIFCDIFAGTGIVGRTFKPLVKKVIANDVEYYAYILNKNYICNDDNLRGKKMLIDELNAYIQIPYLLKTDGFIYQNYCLGGSGTRQYFSDENGKKIDTIRCKIEEWKETTYICNSLYYFLLSSLLEASDKVANTASVYAAYLKHLKKSAKKEIILQVADNDINAQIKCQKNEVFQEDANQLILKIEGDILYLDPPYNMRQYGANYHILNTIAEYIPFIPKGKTGLPKYFRSKYCSPSTIKSTFEQLIKNASFKYIFLSYNNEGLMSFDQIKHIMSKYGSYDVVRTEYQRFKADSSRLNRSSSTVEYLHILKKN